jgi:hypothetical protein
MPRNVNGLNAVSQDLSGEGHELYFYQRLRAGLLRLPRYLHPSRQATFRIAKPRMARKRNCASWVLP